MLRTIGLMSGTSLDGVDAARVDTDGRTIAALGPSLTIAYDDELRGDLRRLLQRAPSLRADDPALAGAARRLTEYHARAVRALGGAPDLIGFHGQTILHDPAGRRTWQIGDAALLARLTGVAVAHDFRSADVAAGGQGAPLAPVFHAALARDLPRPLAVLNIGGVANVTWIGTADQMVAFDTGPGNGPLDDWVGRHLNQRFDRDGAMAIAGRVDAIVLGRLLAHPYFAQPSAEIAGPAGLRRGAGCQRTGGIVAGRRRGDAGGLHGRGGGGGTAARAAAALAGHRRRPAQSGDHGGAAGAIARPGGTGGGGRLGR